MSAVPVEGTEGRPMGLLQSHGTEEMSFLSHGQSTSFLDTPLALLPTPDADCPIGKKPGLNW